MLNFEHNYHNDVNLGGLFIAQVIGADDPQAKGRLRVRVIGVHDLSADSPNYSNKDYYIWAYRIAPDQNTTPTSPLTKTKQLLQRDNFTTTDPVYVYVMFMNNDPTSCFWLGYAATTKTLIG